MSPTRPRQAFSLEGERVIVGLVRSLCLVLAASAVALAWRGLDLGDEGYVLSLIAHPDSAKPAGEVYLFGFLLHPLWELAGADVVRFRLLGWVVLFGATAVAAGQVSAAWTQPDRLSASRRLTLHLFCAAATTVALTFGVRVLGYKTVVLVGLLLAAAGLGLSERRRPVAAGVLVGIALPVTFCGRPTGAVALLVLVVLHLAWARPAGLGRLLSAAVLAAALFTATVLALARMTPSAALTFLFGGAHVVELTAAYPSLPVLLGWRTPALLPLAVLGPPIFVPTALAVWRSSPTSARGGTEWPWWVLLTAAAGATAWRAHDSFSTVSRGYQVMTLLLVVPLLTVVVLLRDRRRGVHTPPHRRRLLALTLLLPYAAAVGTNADLAEATCYAGVFWVLGLGLLVEPAGNSGSATDNPLAALAPLAAAVLALTVVRYADFDDGPHTAQLSRATVPVTTLYGTVAVTQEDADALGALTWIRTTAGIDARTPTVDLSGGSFGYAFHLGGRPLGRAGFFGFFPGAADAAAYALGKEPCADKARAIVLYTPDDPGGVSAAWTPTGVDLGRDYEVIGTFTPTQGAIGWAGVTVQVLRPGPHVGELMGCPG